MEVFHPRWIHVPGTGAITAVLLFLQLIRPALRVGRHFQAQVIDAHFGYPDGVAAFLLAFILRVPFTITLRGSELLHARYPLRRWLMRQAFRRASRIIAVSEQLRRFSVDLGAPSSKTVTISNGVDSSVFFPRDRIAMRRKHNLPLERSIVLTAGHLIELKGHQHVIRAVDKLRRDGVSVDLLIVGGAPARGVRSYEQSLHGLVTQLDISEFVRFVGPVSPETLAELMSAVDLLCLASSREGWPNVVHEAMACGTPVAATNVGAIPELIPSELYGLVIPSSEASVLIPAIHRALKMTWNRASISAWAQSRSWEQVAKEIIREMDQISTSTQPAFS